MIDKDKLLARLEELRSRMPDDAPILDLMDEVEGWAAPHRKLESTTTTVPLDRLLDIGQDEDGSWHVSIIAMPGHVGAADTLEQAIDEAVEAAELWVATLNDRIDALTASVEALIAEVGECVRPADYDPGEINICVTHSEILSDSGCEDQPRALLAVRAILQDESSSE